MKYIKGTIYTVNVNGELKKCKYLGSEFGEDVFEILNTTMIVFKKESNP